MGTGFYGSNDPTNSVKALKEDRSKGSGFNPIRSTPPCSHWYNNYAVWNIKRQIHTSRNKSDGQTNRRISIARPCSRTIITQIWTRWTKKTVLLFPSITLIKHEIFTLQCTSNCSFPVHFYQWNRRTHFECMWLCYISTASIHRVSVTAVKQRFYSRKYNKSTRRAQTSAKGKPDRILSPDFDSESASGWLSRFSGDFHVQKYICHKISRTFHQFFQTYEPNCGKMPYLAMLKNSSKKS